LTQKVLFWSAGTSSGDMGQFRIKVIGSRSRSQEQTSTKFAISAM